MGALAADFSWTAEDDFKLKNAVEGGISLEALAKGLVQFSQRFTIKELQDRWRALLYDPIVSAEASSRMLEFEQCVSASKSNHLDNSKENNTVSCKRKAESVRKRFYAMRKRMRDIPLNSLDPSFPSADFLVCEPVKDSEDAVFPTFEVAGDAGMYVDLNGQAVGPGHQNDIGINDSVEPNSVGNLVSYTFQDNISVDGKSEESDDFDEIYKLLEYEESDLPAIADQTHIGKVDTYSEPGGSETLPLPPTDSETATENPRSPPTLQQMAVWSTDDANNLVTSTDRYLMELQNTLFDMTTEEDLPLMDADGNLIDKSYIDGLSSLLLNSPRKDVAHDITVTAPPVAGGDYDEQFRNNGQDQSGHQEIRDSESILLPSAYDMSPKTNNSTIICTLNTEDPEIPSNDDVFLLPLPPSLARPFMMQRKVFEPPPRRTSSSVRDSSINWQKDNGLPTKIRGISNKFENTQFCMPMIESQLRSEVRADDRINQNVANGDGQRLACGNSISLCDQSQIPKEISCRSNTGGSDSLMNHPRMNAIVGNQEINSAIIQQREASRTEIGSTEVTIPVLVERDSPIDEEESSSLSDYDIPDCSEVEAMILDEDLGQDEHNLSLNGIESSHHLPTFKYDHADIQKKIIWWEQAANAFVRRDMTSQGALAILQGGSAKYYIKKPEAGFEMDQVPFTVWDSIHTVAICSLYIICQNNVHSLNMNVFPPVLLGRATGNVNVDIDLGRQGSCGRVSRRQAIIRMDEEGSFHVKNLSKYPIFVNSMELATNKSIFLASSCLIEIRGISFLFETNQTCIEQYLDRIKRNES